MRKSVMKAIRQTNYTLGTTQTALALNYVRSFMLVPRRGDRLGVTNMVLVITDGVSTKPEDTYRGLFLFKHFRLVKLTFFKGFILIIL